MNMVQITKQNWDAFPEHLKSTWTREIWEDRGRDFPEFWIGRKLVTIMSVATGLPMTEGVDFIFV